MAALRAAQNVDGLRIGPAKALSAVGACARLDITEGAASAAPCAPLAGIERGDLRVIGGLPVGLIKLGARGAAQNAAQSRAGRQSWSGRIARVWPGTFCLFRW